ncbi:MAG: encapsulin, partial [Nocardioidaceae bacterium]
LECEQTVYLAGGSADLVRAVVASIEDLEGRGHYGPFACVLGHTLYEAANTPSEGSLVIPSDRIVPFLDGGALRRSSVVPDEQGVVVALAGSPIDLVVACDVHVSFVQLTLEPRYVLRVSERFVLRMKQPDARCRLTAVQSDQTTT